MNRGKDIIGRAASRVFVCLLVYIAPCLAAALHGPALPAARETSFPVVPQFAIGDFDGDQKPDLASVRASASGRDKALYLIDFRLSTGLQRTFGLMAASGGLRLTSRDVNGDDLLDVVVTTSMTDEPVAIFLNDGRGNFSHKDPNAFPNAFRRDRSGVAAAAEGEVDRTVGETSSSRFACEAVAECSRSPRRAFAPLAATHVPFSGLSAEKAWLGRAPPSLR